MELLEILIPVLFAVGYFIVSALQGKEEKGAGPEREPAHSEDEALSEHEREIQEEIRRKILERSGGQDASAGEYDTSGDESPEYDPTLPDSVQRRRYRQETREIQEYERPDQTQAPRPVYKAPETDWNAWEREPAEEEPPPLEPAMQRQFDDSQDRIRRQQESIEAMERRAEELRKKADSKAADAISDRIGQQRWGASTRRRRRGPEGDFRREVIASLKDQRSFKKVVLAYEILGTPVGLRRENKLGPLWSQQ